MLNNITFLPTYFKTRHELYEEFYKPCMENSMIYNRVSGYFGSSVFTVISSSLKTFINNGGHINIVCSPVLTSDDVNAILLGYSERDNTKIANELNAIIDNLSKQYPNSVELLAKLISSKVLDIKLAVFGDNTQAQRLMHDKAGVFIDYEGNAVAFRGSINETFKGISEYGNSESFDAYTSWENDKDKIRVRLVQEQFQNMWENKEPNITTFNLPDLTIEKIQSFQTAKSIDELINEVMDEQKYKKKNWFAESGLNSRKIKKHQYNILNNWECNGRKGIFEMCTGSGKTFTALCAIRESIFEKNEVPIILVPSKLLFSQWHNELKKVFSDSVVILSIGAGNPIDKVKLNRYTRKNLDVKRCILTTYQSANKDDFIQNVNWGNHIFLISDEVHNIGSNQNSRLLEVEVGPRIGLSATPQRYFDVEGTNKIINFFGGIVLPKYTIKDAIIDGVLCEYFYDIREVYLEEDEQEYWNKLSKDISKRIAIKSHNDELVDIKGLEWLLFERADIVKKAKNKINVAVQILLTNYQEDQRWLVYLDDTDHVRQLKSSLSKYPKFHNKVYEYHTDTEGDLSQTMADFVVNSSIILSINCLDEGVDIPEIEHAIILSSSKNPRQYIQRRGRVLRKSKNKQFAYIYDCIVSPNEFDVEPEKNLSIIRGEVARAYTFAENAKNTIVVRNKLEIIMNKNNIQINEGDFGYED